MNGMISDPTDPFFDLARWQRMLAAETGVPGGIGLLRRQDFVARAGTLLLFRGDASGVRVGLSAYSGEAGAETGVLLVADAEAVRTLQAQGLGAARALLRQGRLHPYMLKMQAQLEESGLADFVEDLGLTHPKH